MKLPQGMSIHVITHADNIRAFMCAAPTSRAQITCFRCGEQGHYKSECFHWKTRMCWHYLNDKCRDPGCSFAHGNAEIRSPWMPRCIRVIKRDGLLTCIGCKSYGHTYKYCPQRADAGEEAAHDAPRDGAAPP